jgi:hypothetical protein
MPMAHHLWPIQRGDVLVLRDEDYLFGQGDLLLRVATVHEVRLVWGGVWIFLRGVELRADGHGRQWRDVLVRREAMRTRRRRPV